MGYYKMPEDIKSTHIFDLDLPELHALFEKWNEPSYRAVQVWEGLYHQFYSHPDDFSTLPKSLREKLADHLEFSHLTPKTTLDSRDGQTRKTLFELPDGKTIEAVLMQYKKRHTLCISTQAGCALGCVFCATGQMGLQRNLSSGEIVEQVIHFARLLHAQGGRPTNVVVMGMGEPFHNYEETLAAITRLNHPQGLNFGARRFTISTVGLVPMIRRFSAEKRQINLAISLHAANDELRSSMLPINKKYPLAQLLQACREYVDQTHRRITFEWALIQDVNDSVEHAVELALLLRGLICHVNLIPLNPTSGFQGRGSSHERAQAFQNTLQNYQISCTVRVRRGIDIQAGCGQLATENDRPA
jgi:23S rRNA (adenine2503-C2)-methyltransferase